MRSEKFSESLNEIDEKFIDKAVNYQAGKKSIRWVTFVSAAACLGIAVFGAAAIGRMVRDTPALTSEVPVQSAVIADSVTAAAATEGVTGPLSYSQLSVNDGKADVPLPQNFAGSISDIMMFDESLTPTCAVIEGEIIDIYVKEYDYGTAFDKFEAGGVMNHKDMTIVYKIKAEKVLYGDFFEGEVVTVEDRLYVLESIAPVKKGGKYVIPIYEQGSSIAGGPDEVVDGDVKRESIYATTYQFHPQIEAVSGGYVVPGDWKTLVSGECVKVNVDIADFPDAFRDRMYFVPHKVFTEKMNEIIARELES